MIPLIALLAVAADVNYNYITVDVRTREVVKQDWPDAEAPVPVGSLVKPFTALAYAGDWPGFVCKGSADGCWLARGHGRVEFRQALAESCNAYFLNLARGVDAGTLRVVATKFGIPAPDRDTAEARIGLGTAWKISPLALARAYCELAARASEPRVGEILDGLRMAAQSGTARAIGRGRLAKTGTAACVSERHDAGDGFAMVLDPADAPRVALLVLVHGAPGAAAAKIAARMLQEK
jgi:cell division protein FtsI/penicillin-binding protein 2